MTRVALVLLVVLTSGLLQAEPLYPLLRPAQADSLRRQLWHTPASPQRVALLLRLGNDLLVRARDFGTPLDSAEAYCQQAGTLSRRLRDGGGQLNSYYSLGNLRLISDQPAEGKKLLLQGLTGSIQQHATRLAADGWYYLSTSYTFAAADSVQRLNCLRHALASYQTVGDALRAAYVLKTIADLHMTLGRHNLARTELHQVLARYRAAGYHRLHYTYHLLTVASARLGDYQTAIRYGLAAVESAQATADTTSLNMFYNLLGNVYWELKQYPDALTYYRRALQRAERAHDHLEVLGAAYPIAQLLIIQHRPQQALRLAQQIIRQYPPGQSGRLDSLTLLASCYLANQQYRPAEGCIMGMLTMMKKQPTVVGGRAFLLDVYLMAMRLYLGTHQYDQARLYANKVWAFEPEASLGRKVTIRQLLFRLDSAQGNYVAAIRQQQQYQRLHDSIFNEKKSKQIASLQIQYDTRKKEQDLALLSNQNQVQQVDLQRREEQRNALLVGVAMLALLLALGYSRYQVKQRSNRLLEGQRQEIANQNQALEKVLGEKEGLLEQNEWMLKEIHHRVKNNLQIIGSLLRSQSVYLQDKAARAAVRESRNRVHSMALIHQKLYQSHHLAGVPMDTYIQEIVDHLLASFDCPPSIQAELAVALVELDVALAVPVGLILNEAITNSLKYAFPDAQAGHLFVGFDTPAADCYQLTIRDDGVGLGADFAPEHCRTLGLSLIQGLSKQLGGHLQVQGIGGVHISLEFKKLEILVRA